MIAIRLMGGLGNQMFQYALIRKLSIKNKINFSMDLTFYENIADSYTLREYELSCFNVVESFLPASKRPNENLDSKRYTGLIGKKKLIEDKLKKRDIWTIYRESHHNFDNKALLCKNNSYLIGYWQTEKYFSDIRKVLLNDFSYKENPNSKNSLFLNQIKSSPSISLHVRRGDYVTNENANQFHGIKDNEYYKSALKKITNNPSRFNIFVFSDDIEWCKKNLNLGTKMIFVTGNKKGSEDMRLMMNCNHNIIANSSFSWWAAWLNNNPSKIVVAPSKWFNDESINTSDIIPKTWVKV